MDKRTRLGVGDKAPKPPELVGKIVLGRYFVEAELGSGAMGTVYRARNQKLGRDVALKVMHDHLVHEPMLLARFYREAKLAGRLQHPNVVAVLDVDATPDGKQIMVLELVEGTSLGDLILEPMAQPRIIELVKQILRGLAHAHAAGLVHRDLKPDNMIVRRGDDGVEILQIVDFGIAALRGDGADAMERLTGTGMIVGTPLYMSPEQARAEHVDHRADLYALGVIIYEMLTGLAPFEGTAMEVAVAKMDKDPIPLSVRAPDVAVEPVFEAYMRKLLARLPDDRFATAHDALEVLELYERDREGAAAALGIIDVAKALAMISLPGI